MVNAAINRESSSAAIKNHGLSWMRLAKVCSHYCMARYPNGAAIAKEINTSPVNSFENR